MTGNSEGQEVAVPILWVGESDEPIVFANQFNIAHQGVDEFILTVGQVATPLLVGTDEEKKEQAEALSYVPIQVVGRYTFSRERLAQLIEVLSANLERYDSTMKKKEG